MRRTHDRPAPLFQEAQRRREEWPQKEAQLQAHWQAGMARRTPVLAKWLPVLFWVLLCSRAVNLLDQLGITAGLQGAVTVVEVLTGAARWWRC